MRVGKKSSVHQSKLRNSWCQIVRGIICYRTPPEAASEKDGSRRQDINDGIFINEKEKKS